MSLKPIATKFLDALKAAGVGVTATLSVIGAVASLLKAASSEPEMTLWIGVSALCTISIGLCLVVIIAKQDVILAFGSSAAPRRIPVYRLAARRLAGAAMVLIICAAVGAGWRSLQVPSPPRGHLRLMLAQVRDLNGSPVGFTEQLYHDIEKQASEIPEIEVQLSQRAFSYNESAAARRYAARRKADIIVWGWAKVVSGQMRLNIHFELLNEKDVLSPTWRPALFREPSTPVSLDQFAVLEADTAQVHFAALLAVAMAQQGLGKYERAAEIMDRAIAVENRANPALKAELLYLKGISFYHLARFDEAIAAYNDALTRNPRLAIAYEARALAQNSIGQSQAALEDMVQYEKYQSPDEYFYLNRASIYLSLREPAKAEADCRRGIAMRKDRMIIPATHINLASALAAQGKNEEGVKELDELLRTIRLPWAIGNRADMLSKLDRLEEAEKGFSEAASLDPSWNWYFGRAQVRKRLQRPADALADAEKAESFNPPHAAVWFDLAVLRKQFGDFDGAIRGYTKALELDPANGAALNNRVYAHLAKKDLASALADADAQVKLTPQVLNAYYTRSDVFVALNRTNDALADLERAKSLVKEGDTESSDFLAERIQALAQGNPLSKN